MSITTNTPTKSPRRHDLDALRAVAMLLGIVFHAALAFPPIGWTVQDSQQHDGFGLVCSVIQGFHMPLFFVMSGFFTAMLWRKRGLRALLQHRFRRIFLPLVLGLVTIVPAMNVISRIAIASSFEQLIEAETAKDEDADIWTAAKMGDTDAILEHLAYGADINALDPEFGTTPSLWAVFAGQTETAELLITRGADVNVRHRDGGTPLHGAALFGRTGLVELLIEHGADVNAVDNNGMTPPRNHGDRYGDDAGCGLRWRNRSG